METETSPPLALIAEITPATAVSDDTALVPPQVGLQPPPVGARMKASWNALRPVASMMAVGRGGLLSSGLRYGAAGYHWLLSALAETVAPLAWPAPSAAAVPSPAKARAAAATPEPRALSRFTSDLLWGNVAAESCRDANPSMGWSRPICSSLRLVSTSCPVGA